jgi:putative endonuclease
MKILPISRPALGAEKERLACRFLEARGLRLVARNHRCRLGEIDLVMTDGGVLVFVEVRYRRSARFAAPAETVGPRKRQRLAAAAGHYLQQHPTRRPCRFDVLAITGPDAIDWIQDAFRVDE